MDGGIKKIVNITKSIHQKDEEEIILEDIPPNLTPHTPIQEKKSGPLMTPLRSTRKASCNQENTPSSGQTITTTIEIHSTCPSSPHSISSNSTDISNPTLASLTRQKIISLRVIYEKNEGENNAGLNSLFALYSHVDDPVHFEYAIKDKKWINAM